MSAAAACRQVVKRASPGFFKDPERVVLATYAKGERSSRGDLAGLSVDYVVRLEQGRASSPSGQVVSALARALRLSVQERDHL
jgi:hypothetical protein